MLSSDNDLLKIFGKTTPAELPYLSIYLLVCLFVCLSVGLSVYVNSLDGLTCLFLYKIHLVCITTAL